jgi:uncharacterized protein YbjT (DUF2867 family)
MSTGKILITGATGDTGGYAIEQLLHKGHQVRALVHRRDNRSQRLQDKGVEVVAGDFLDLDAMRAAVKGVHRAEACQTNCRCVDGSSSQVRGVAL